MAAPKIAIIGRPNVGKSTLFNRLAGKPLAIVDDQPGVTRDRREADGRLGDLKLRLIDTAGFDDLAAAGMEREMRAQTEAAVAACDLCLFVVDARSGVTALDETFADLIRRSGKPVVLIANKAEGRAGEGGRNEAWALGLGDPVAMSAAHGEGLGELYAAVAGKLDGFDDRDVGPDEDDGDTPPLRIAVAGRPNAGKSTLINALLGEDRLITGPEAGITRDAIAVDWLWDGKRVRFHDTAGLRKRGKVADRLERMSAADTLRAVKFAEVVLVLIDVERPLEKQDLHIADLVVREGRGLVVILSKWDTVPNRTAALKDLRYEFERLLPQAKGTPLIPVSALKKKGLEDIMPAVADVHRNWSAKIKTRDLNDWLRDMTARHPPPAVNGRRVKPKYMSQTKSRPPTFVLMCSRAAAMPDAYKRYLINGLREEFDMPGVPIRLIVKSGKNPYADGDRGGSGG
ncbi:ribosome biogenesis GTPase Der [Hyphobacterium marinum]|uniref:GTPase Der n=1 Tax=Hyphobacterium marinum TaxID=3116574 RepID=A0ABU7M041_9PROT|nr:ribosome biogenesis GTPase Der [Hyphobacterium sp. Y6023]MEE2567168.1 ribosome biogenesis GTPase Der [Hyphobacterium sp. Y6023]